MFSIDKVLLPLSRDKTRWAAYCDSCLVGSFVFRGENDRTSRYVAVAHLRSLGWTHEVPKDIPEAGKGIAGQAWTGETFCFECTSMRARRQA
jgi:hypothetical protein